MRDEEKKLGLRPRLISQNSDRDEGLEDPNTDWAIIHGFTPTFPMPKVTSDNEYNPFPPATCDQVRAKWCKGQNYNAHVAAWRHEQGKDAWVCSQGVISEAKPCAPWEKEGCSFNVGTVDEVFCKVHAPNIWDCTPKIGGRPVQPEGQMDRADCERVGMKGYPSYYLHATSSGSTLEIRVRGNPMQFSVSGHGRGLLRCTIPARGAENVCNDLWIEQ